MYLERNIDSELMSWKEESGRKPLIVRGARQAGGKFVYTKVSQVLNTGQIKEALELLIMAGLVIPVIHSSANGIPLGAEVNPKKRKMLLLDTGVFHLAEGASLPDCRKDKGFKQSPWSIVLERVRGIMRICEYNDQLVFRYDHHYLSPVTHRSIQSLLMNPPVVTVIEPGYIIADDLFAGRFTDP